MSMSDKKRNRLFWIIQITFMIVVSTIAYITLYRPLADVSSQFEDVTQQHERAIASQKEKASKSVAPIPRTAEMLAAFEPMISPLVAGLNELSADEQLAVIKQMRSNLRELFSSDPTVTEATLDEMTDIFIRKMEAEGFIRRF